MDAKLTEIITEIFDLEGSQVADDLTSEQVDQWDSMNHLRMITAVEQEFDIKLTMDEIQSIDSIGKLRQITQQHCS